MAFEDNNEIEFDQEAVNNAVQRVNVHPEKEEDTEPDQETKTKKFVVEIQSEYVEYVEHLSREQRNDVINYLIEESFVKDEEEKQAEDLRNKLKLAVAALITMVIGLPVAFWLINFSIDATQSNYKGMQNNFHELYKSKGR